MPIGILEGGRAAKCSKVAGDAQTVHCLGRLRPTDLHRLLRSRSSLVLARGDCADCDLRSKSTAYYGNNSGFGRSKKD